MKDFTTGDFIEISSLYRDGSSDYYILKVTDITVIKGITLESSNTDFIFEESTHNMTSREHSYKKITDRDKIEELEAKNKLNLIKNS